MKWTKINKKPLIFILIGIVVGIIGVTFAYYYTEIQIPNQFQSMTYDVKLEEVFNNTWGTKEVYITNAEETSAPVVIRVSYDEIWSEEVDGNLVVLSNTIGNQNVVTKNWTTTFLNDFEDRGEPERQFRKSGKEVGPSSHSP